MVYVSFDVLQATHDNTNFHYSVEQGSSVKITCHGISKSTSGLQNLNKINNQIPKRFV